MRYFDAFDVPKTAAAELPEPTAGIHEPASSGGAGSEVTIRPFDGTPARVAEIADAVVRARSLLVSRPSASIVESLGRVGVRFLDRGDPLRREALALLPGTSGLSPEMSAVVLDGMARDWVGARLAELVRSELGGPSVLDGFVNLEPPPVREGHTAGTPEQVEGRHGEPARERSTAAMVVGPSLCVQIVSGSVPGVGVTALVRSLLVKGPTVIKPGRGDVVLPVLFARALREADPELAEALGVVYWPGGQEELERALLSRADVVAAYGSDESVADVRSRTPVTARFVPYHHRVSVGIVGREAVSMETLAKSAREVAEAAAIFDQRGCVSPQVIFVEAEGDLPSRFARALAGALEDLEGRLPSGKLEPDEASRLQQLRGTAELLAEGDGAEVIHGGASPWTVVVESGESTMGSCVGRAVRLRAVRDADEVPALLAPLGPHLQTVGVAGLGDRMEEMAGRLGLVGASRVVPFESVAFPPPWWHHDGRGPLLDLVRWVDLEGA